MSYRHTTWICLVLLALSGCTETTQGIPVSGTITWQGQPLAKAALTFFPAKGRPTTASVSSEGTYACRLAVGDYRVTASLSVELPTGWKEGDRVPKQPIKIPSQYSSRAKTPLTANITAESNHPLDFELK